jgi:hypothetical protein
MRLFCQLSKYQTRRLKLIPDISHVSYKSIFNDAVMINTIMHIIKDILIIIIIIINIERRKFQRCKLRTTLNMAFILLTHINANVRAKIRHIQNSVVA